jgi:hypothetical protein
MSVELAMKRFRSGLAPGRLAIALVAGLAAAGATASAQQQNPQAPLRQACAADFKSLCSGVQPGGGRIKACLREHADQLSPSCKSALVDAAASRQAKPSAGQLARSGRPLRRCCRRDR